MCVGGGGEGIGEVLRGRGLVTELGGKEWGG